MTRENDHGFARPAAWLLAALLAVIAGCTTNSRSPATQTSQASQPPAESAQPSSSAASEPDAATPEATPKEEPEQQCDEGDKLMGPNCVNEQWHQAGVLKRPFSKVYRTVDGQRSVLWDDQGSVVESTPEYLIVIQFTLTGDGMGDADVRCLWEGKRYSRDDCKLTGTP